MTAQVARVSLRYNYGVAPGYVESAFNVLAVSYPAGGLTSGFAGQIQAAFIQFGLNTNDRRTTWSNQDLIRVSDTQPGGPSFDFPGAGGGLNVNGPLPLQVAMCCSLRTALNTRRGRGRVFFPHLTEGDTTAPSPGVPVWETTAVSDMNSAFNTLQATLQSFGSNLLVHSRVGNMANIVTDVLIGNIPDTQRRRRLTPETYTT